MSRTGWPVLLAGCAVSMLLASQATGAAEDRPTFWDLPLGATVDQLPTRFVEYACGTNGGPPGRPLKGFAEFAECRPDDQGLYEVHYRYDDEQEFIARALEQARIVERYAGTKVFGIPVLASVLFDAEGVVKGLRLVTDPRGVEVGGRNDHWTLGTTLMHHFGDEGWACEDDEPGLEETAVATYFVKDTCRKSTDEATLIVHREYLHRRGQSFMDEFGKVQVTYFVSTTEFEMFAPGIEPM